MGLVPAAAVVGMGLWRDVDGRLRLSLFDDAMISMSYARTLAGGDGLVWYPGAERVEGITNPAWTALMTLGHLAGLGGSAVAAMMVVLGLGCVWGTALVGRRLVAGVVPSAAVPTFATVVVVAASLPLVYWSLRGMEVAAVSLVVMVATTACWRLAAIGGRTATDLAALVLALAFGVTLRNDVAVVGAALALWLVAFRRDREGLRLAGIVVGTVAAATVAVSAARWAYYGEILPNTYHLKVSGIALSDRLGRGMSAGAIVAGAYVLAPLALVAAAWPALDRRARDLVGLVLSVGAVSALYSIYVGGDAWEQFLLPNRYLTPAVTLLGLVAVACTFAARETPGRVPARRWAAAAVVVGAGPSLSLAAVLAVMAFTDGYGGLRPALDERLVVPATIVAVAGCVVAAVLLGRRDAAGRSALGARSGALALSMLLLVALSWRLPHTGTDDGTRFSRLADQLSELTLPGARIAASGVGGMQYWSNRTTLDVLGKNDERIARSEPASETFLPGHDKYDLDRTVGELRPDVVAQGIAAEDLERFGYVPVTPLGVGALTAGIVVDGDRTLFVRPDSDLVRWEMLEPLD